MIGGGGWLVVGGEGGRSVVKSVPPGHDIVTSIGGRVTWESSVLLEKGRSDYHLDREGA